MSDVAKITLSIVVAAVLAAGAATLVRVVDDGDARRNINERTRATPGREFDAFVVTFFVTFCVAIGTSSVDPSSID